MWRITLKGVLAHKVRYALTALAVLLGVAFMAGTLVLTDTIGQTFDGLFSSIYSSTSAVIRGTEAFSPGTNFSSQRPPIDASVAEVARSVPGVKAVSVSISGYAQLVGRDGKPIGLASNGPPTLGEAWSDVPSLNPLHLLAGGRPPHGPSEVVIDKHSADVGHFAVGDHVVILTHLAPASYLIVGVAKWGTADSPLGASIAAFDVHTAARVLGTPGKVDQVNVQASPGVSEEQLVARLAAAIHRPGVEVVSGQAVTQEGEKAIRDALGFFNTFLLVFALVALFVGSFLIFNTFSIVVAQRRREFALLRAVGASRAQVTRTVLGESLTVGLVASAFGLVVGVGLAALLKAGLAALGIDIPAAGLVVTARTVVVTMSVGTVVTVLAAVLPARRASRVPPVAAMQDHIEDIRGSSLTRVVLGAATTLAGVALLAAGLFGTVASRVALVGAGAAAIFIGVAILGPLFARQLSRALGAPLAWRRVTGSLARSNAMRNPARTSSTAAALMVGVALVSLMSVVASSTIASVDSIINSAVKADFVISSGTVPGSLSGFSPALVARLAEVPGVAAVTGIRSGIVEIGGGVRTIIAADPAHIDNLFDIGVVKGAIAKMTAHGVAVSTAVASQRHLGLGSAVVVTFPATGPQRFAVQAIYKTRALAGDYVLPIAAAAANFTRQLDFQVYLKLAPGVSAAQGRAAIDQVLRAYPTATLLDQAQYKAKQSQQINQLLNLVYGLLALAVLIALIGIANTLALSISERTRELGLLRAVGMTRRQLRASVRSEAVIIALFGAVEGLVVGVLFGWALVAALASSGITTLRIPIGQLLVVAVLAGAAGVLAAVVPGRRAARLDVLRAITAE